MAFLGENIYTHGILDLYGMALAIALACISLYIIGWVGFLIYGFIPSDEIEGFWAFLA